MPRPKSDDPKLPLPIRVRSAILAGFSTTAAARAAIEALVEATYGTNVLPKAPAKVARDVIGFTASGEAIHRPALVSRPKAGLKR